MKLFKFLFVIIFLWAVALRAPELLSGNFLFGFDIGRDFAVAQSIVVDHKLTLIGAELGSGSAGIHGIFQGPGYYYLLAIVYWIFNGDPYGALVLMFVFGVLTLIATYWTVKRIFDRWSALVGLFLVGISPLIVSQSRFMWSPHPVSFLVVILFYLVYMIPKRPIIFAPIAVLLTGLTYHFELAMTIPMMIAIIISLPLIYRIANYKVYLLSFLAIIVSFVPAIAFEMRHGWRAISSLLTYTVPGGVVGRDVWLLRIQDHSVPYIANATNSFITEFGLLPNYMFICLSIFLFISLCFLAIREKNKTHRRFFQFLLLQLVVSYVVLLFLNNIIWDYYLIHAHFIYIYVFGYLFVRGIVNFRKSYISKLLTITLIVFIVSMVVSTSKRMYISYTYDYYDLGGVEKIRGKKIAIDYCYNQAQGNPFSVFVFMPPIYTYPYDYLFKTYGVKKYGYPPGNQKTGRVCLIIEPDHAKPWTYKGWLETVIVDGKILKTETLVTGHIIQVRQFP